MNYRSLALLPLLCLAPACQQGATPPAEPMTAPASSAEPSPGPVVSAEPAPLASAEPAPAVPVASAVPIASAEPSKEPAPVGSAAAPTPKGGKPAAASSKPAAAPAPVAETTPAAGPEDPCTTKNFHYSQVAGACKTGGRKAAKNVMKGVVSKAKAAGTDLKCTSCHADMSSFALKGNAVTDLKQWL